MHISITLLGMAVVITGGRNSHLAAGLMKKSQWLHLQLFFLTAAQTNCPNMAVKPTECINYCIVHLKAKDAAE